MRQKRLRRALFAILSLSLITGCSPLYVVDAALEQASILSNREPIETVLADPATPELTKEKLRAVLDARTFSHEALGLTPDGSFTTYTDVHRDVLSWIVMAVRKDSFELKTWWFPIVGSVPYKGFFDKDQAERYAQELQADGLYETWVRPTDAYSTLGWFDDPILSTTLQRPVTSVVETVIHEIFHQTVWLPGQAPFNETAANIVGLQGAALFFQTKYPNSQHVQATQARLRDAASLAAIVAELYTKLSELYQSDLPQEQKLIQRTQIFEAVMQPWRQRLPQMKAFATLNNAEILQLKTYFTDFDILTKRFEEAGTVSAFVHYLAEVTKEAQDKESTPYDIYRLPFTNSTAQ
jgi:predicted aminopeptidase